MAKQAVNKYRLPSDVTRLNPGDLNRNHVVVMLDYLGVPTSRQPKDKTKKAEMLRERIVAEPVKAQAAYDVIVFNKLPDAAAKVTADAEAMKAHFMAAMRDTLESEQHDAVKSKLVAMAEELRSGLEAAGKAALAEAAKNYRPVVIKEGKVARTVKGVLPQEFERIMQLASQRVPVMMVGPAGCGKTYIASKVAEGLGLDFSAQSCSEGVSESIFTGWLLPVGAGGKFEYVESPYVHAYENGGVFLLDEIDASDPNLLTFLNMGIANDGFYLPQRHKKPYVKKHKDFVILAAANTFGRGADADYVGRNALDAATLDRYRAGMIHMDYSAEVETALVDSEVLAWGLRVRKVIHDNKLRRIMSTRVMLDLTKMKTGCGWQVEQWERSYFSDWSDTELRFWRNANARV